MTDKLSDKLLIIPKKGGFSNGSINVIMKCDNSFAALSGNGENDQKIVFIAGFLTRI